VYNIERDKGDDGKLLVDIHETLFEVVCPVCNAQRYCSEACFKRAQQQQGHVEVCTRRKPAMKTLSSLSSSSSSSSRSSTSTKGINNMYFRLVMRLIGLLLHRIKSEGSTDPEKFLELWKTLDDLHHLTPADVAQGEDDDDDDGENEEDGDGDGKRKRVNYGVLPLEDFAELKQYYARDPMDLYLLNGGVLPVLTSDGWIRLCSLLMLNCYGIEVSPAIWKSTPTGDDGDSIIGGGGLVVRNVNVRYSPPASELMNPNPKFFNLVLCPISSYINHSCKPNVQLFHQGDNHTRPSQTTTSTSKDDGKRHLVEVVALEDIAKGDEIVTSYLPLRLEFQERQAALASRYGFVCSCERCKQESG